jgi:hypothetical protein
MVYLAIGCRATVATVFALAVAGKVIGAGAFTEFTRSVIDMNAVPRRLALPAAWATVLTEGLTVVLVLIPLRSAGIVGCALALVLTAAFSSAIARSIRAGNQAACRCFGRSSTPLRARHLVRNGLLLLMALLGLVASSSGSSAAWSSALVSAVAGLFIGLAVAGFDEIAQLLAPV